MKRPEILTPSHWKDYELIDSGEFEKLERFGKYILIRPEPQAIWTKSLPASQWLEQAHARFDRQGADAERGSWHFIKKMKEQWWVNYRTPDYGFRMRLGLTAFKHVGIFPEQAANWDYIYEKCRELSANLGRPPKVLNLFAYTGGATLAARAAGAEVTHVDSVKQVVTWAAENLSESGMEGVRWLVEDAMTFVKREVRRGNRYDAIILDPPAYGRGPSGEKWVLEKNISELLEACSRILSKADSFLVFNLYSMGLSALLAKSAVNQLFGTELKSEQFGELYFDDHSGKSLPLGVYYRFFR